MKNRLLVIGGLIASIAGVLVIFDALGVSDLRRCLTTAESYHQSTVANLFVALCEVILSDHPKPITNSVDTESKTLWIQNQKKSVVSFY